ncbi:soluble lytic murein transglycosylase [Sphingomonas vulcanisoli]|uniref:Soluble lytic murein transglycosylase n=1 Tax=Sphingomonas vulcanisoli TaxID=1658060 RepID=A0ABX0TNB2_9SPHN|nr:soluble lytic murein transglycosylase [Sphingomonas vulcanisoli]
MPPALSSGGARWTRVLAPAVVLASVAAAAATLTLQQPSPPAADAMAPPPAAAALPSPALNDPLWPVIGEWNRLRQSDGLPFSNYATFLIAHRGWPGETAMRRAAERTLRPDTDPQTAAAYFALYPPLTSGGRVRYAEALAALGRTDEAKAAAVTAWAAGALSADDEGRLTARFATDFTLADQDRRMERLLWDGAIGSAQRQLALVSPGRRPIYAARLGFQTKAPDAQITAAAVGPGADRDPGYAIDRANWLRNTAQSDAARAYLAGLGSFDAPPLDAKIFLQNLLTIASGAAHDGQSQLAYQIALLADAAYPAGASVRDQPLASRDPYTSLVWLGGQVALKKLARPKDAEAMFARYTAASASPGSQAKGEYWAGRAAQAAGNAPGSQAHFATAARQIDQFYGQLATERLGQTIAVPPPPPPVVIADDARTAFANREVVRAAKLLGAQGRWLDQTQFVRQIASDAKSDSDHVLADELALSLGRPDLAVIVSRNARTSGARDPIRSGFPTIAVPPAWITHWTMIHALSRQESQFDRAALSGAGARGLMQLMPATAREQAGKLGLPWDPARLTQDPGYNVMIGASFFDRMMSYYSGSYVLAVASYNAGPGNVNRFIRDNGDPRLPGVDVVDWIEAIPLSETRTYVQKVLENAVIYDLFNPARAKTPERNRLSHYLGKQSAG